MKKILIFGMTEGYGGVENFLANYCKNMDNSKIQFDVLTYVENFAYNKIFTQMGGEIITVTSKHKNIFQNKVEIIKFFKNNGKNYSAIWCNLCEITNLDILKYAKKYGIPKIIIHSHNTRSTRKGLPIIMHKINRKKIHKYATDYWACSDLAGEWFFNKTILKSNKYRVINNAIDINTFSFSNYKRVEKRKELGIETNLVLGNVARFHYQKNQDFLIDIFECVYRRNKNARLLLIGSGEDEEKIKNKVNNLKLSNAVKFLGRRQDIPDLLQAMDIFLLPSLFEGLPIVLIEAQATGLRSFTSDKVVSKAAQITNLLEYISLEKDADYWAEKILQKSDYIRRNTSEEIKSKGYDIKSEAIKVQELLLG